MKESLMNRVPEESSILVDQAKEAIKRFSQGDEALIDAARRFVSESLNLGDLSHYKIFPQACFLIARDALRFGEKGSQRLLLVALHLAMLRSLQSEAMDCLPVRVKGHQLKQYSRILASVNLESAWMNLESDFFHKEYGLAGLRLYAASAQVIDPRCGVPRSTFLKSGLSGLLRGMQLLIETKGFSPMFQIHTHSLFLDEFDESGWNECYRCCADLYKLHPGAKGMFGGSWFYDPAVLQISPRLAYLQSIPLYGGAQSFLVASEGEHVHDAIATSPTRRKLYEEGRYHPKSYMLIWPRARQISWAAAHVA